MKTICMTVLMVVMLFTVTIVTAGDATASALTVPNSFSPGGNISSAQMNANFSAVATSVNDNNNRVTTLETKMSKQGLIHGYKDLSDE